MALPGSAEPGRAYSTLGGWRRSPGGAHHKKVTRSPKITRLLGVYGYYAGSAGISRAPEKKDFLVVFLC